MRPDPEGGLRRAFERIAATRMAGMALANPRLGVATVGFSAWDDVRVGILVTPWAINLAAVSADPAALLLAPDRRRSWRFPSGRYELMGGCEPECGAFQFCSLFSPVFEFDDAAAMAVARAAIEALFAPAGDDAREAARLAGRSALDAPLDRRAFLRGALGAASK